jgi:hypothetical protein
MKRTNEKAAPELASRLLNQVKAQPTSTEPPSTMPASECCPGQPRLSYKFFTHGLLFAFGHGGNHPGYVSTHEKIFPLPSIF